MNKKLLKISVVGIVVGSMLLYMSIMGASGFGLALVGTNFKEDFNAYPGGIYGWSTGSGSGWVWGTPVISPAGQLEMNALVGGRCSTVSTSLLPSWPSQFTVEFRLKVDQFGGGTRNFQMIGLYAGTYWVPLCIFSDHITVDGAGTVSFSTVTDNAWHVWTLVCSASSFDVYRDTTKLATAQNTLGSAEEKVSLDTFGGTVLTGTLVHFDYFYVDAGLYPPGGETTYSLLVNAQCGGAPLSGPLCTVGDSTPFSVPHTWSLASSAASATIASSYVSGTTTYTFSQWDNGGTSNTRSGTLSAGSNTWTATYTTNTPGLYSVTVLTKDSSGVEFSNCQVTFNGVTKSSGSAVFIVAAGTYSVSVQTPYNSMAFSHWENGGTANLRSVYVGSTVTLTATFTGSGPGPWDPLAWLRNLLNNFTVRSYELYAGSAAVVLSSLLMAVAFFVKKKTAAAMPFIG